jgi:predicted enzyme related to lactoylglutathione lyase
MATVSFWAEDLGAAIQWYSELLGVEPYFVRPKEGPPAYAEFRLGDYQAELGLIDRRYGPPNAPNEPGGAVLYWHVDDVQATFDRLLKLGATPYEPITKREAGFITAAVVDPFGNVLGVMYNPHYLEILEKSSPQR